MVGLFYWDEAKFTNTLDDYQFIKLFGLQVFVGEGL